MERIISVGRTTIVTAVVSSLLMACTQGGFRSYRMDMAKYQALQKAKHNGDPTIQQNPEDGGGNPGNDDSSGAGQTAGEAPPAPGVGTGDKKEDAGPTDSAEVDENPHIVPKLLVEIEQGLAGDLTVETLEALFKEQHATNSLVKGMSVEIQAGESALALDFKIVAEAEKQMGEFEARVKMDFNKKGISAIMKVSAVEAVKSEEQLPDDTAADAGIDAGSAAAAAVTAAESEVEQETGLVAGTLICVEDSCDNMIGLIGVKSETGAEKVVFKLTKNGELTGPFKSFVEAEGLLVKSGEQTDAGTGPAAEGTEGQNGSTTDSDANKVEQGGVSAGDTTTTATTGQQAARGDAKTAQMEALARAQAAKAEAAQAQSTSTGTVIPMDPRIEGLRIDSKNQNKGSGSITQLPASASNGMGSQSVDRKELEAAARAAAESKAASTQALAKARTERALREEKQRQSDMLVREENRKRAAAEKLARESAYAKHVADAKEAAKKRAGNIAARKAQMDARIQEERNAQLLKEERARREEEFRRRSGAQEESSTVDRKELEAAAREERQRQSDMLVQEENRKRAAARARMIQERNAKLLKGERERRQAEANKRLGIIPQESEAGKTDF